ncbi:SDR family oxidoreductase [Thalassobacillus sp. B23F22_16]|uniref:SDR family oxidoreductase n=1 Tax=Thalassobacillus sp. B23F22_16 TaxID=3459513 RepID=UPI00373EBC8B
MNILLTGSTGFLGGKLMKELIHGTDHHLYILARNLEKAERMKAGFQAEDQHRLHLITGDITLPYFGLQPDMVTSLTGKIDCIYHSAALVKFDEALRDELFAINYEGTKHALELANQLSVRKFFYVSTAYTVGKRHTGVEDLYPEDDSYHNPYEESKVKAEHLVFSYGNDMEVAIFRPSIIVGDSKTGEADSEFTLYGFMRALEIFKRRMERKKENDRQTTYRVVANPAGTSNFVPVDYVAEILALGLTRAEPYGIYNITNPNPSTNAEVLDLFQDALGFHRLTTVDDHQHYELSPEEEKLNDMIDTFKVYLASDITFEDDNTQRLIRGTETRHLHMSREMLEMIIHAYFTFDV